MTFIEEYIQLLDDDFFTAMLIIVEIPIASIIIIAVFYNMILKGLCWDLSFKYKDRNTLVIKLIKLIAGWK